MNGLRLVLIGAGCLFVIAACGALIGIIDSVREGDATSPSLWLSVFVVEVMLVSIAVVLFRSASRIARRQRRREDDAVQSEASVELFCPRCDSANLVQGPEDLSLLLRKSYAARCLGCGEHVKVSAEDWRRLPLPEIGEAHETWADKRHLMRRLPMTAGQTALVLLGLFGWLAIMMALDEDEREFGAAAFLIVPACWWLGRLLFGPKRANE